MISKIDKIIVLGGGSAGWMTAATLIRFFPKKEIVLIESPEIPIIGVGESTLGQINNWLAALGISDEDFMKACDASYKYAIKFVDFLDVNCEPFYYPFGRMCVEGTSNLGPMDWHLKKALYPETPVQDYARSFMPVMALVDRNRINKNLSGVFDNMRFDKDTAYHFNAVKFSSWLRDQYSIPKGVKHIQTIIKTATENETGIESIIDSNGNVHSADLFIDCTGFKSFLLGQTFKEKFIDYSDMLPNNKAWACQVPYVDIEKELQCFTNCTALGNGWVWNTPLFSRIGTGYVYSDRFVSDEAALDEFKSYLCSYKMSTARNKEQVDEYSFRNLSFRSGIHERTFVKNVCAIGLSAGFLEPLESNGLFTIHEFILKLVKTIGRGKISRWDKDVYNVTTRNQFENFAEFVGIHYALSQRTDTEYWRYNFNKNFDKDMLSLAKKKTTGYFDLANQYMFDWTFSTDYPAGTHFIATGMDYRPLDECRLTMAEWLHRRDYKNLIDQSNEIWKKKQCQWIAAAEASPTHYHYLKNTIYKDI